MSRSPAAPPPPDVLQRLLTLAGHLASASKGQSSALVREFAQSVGRTPNTIYIWLRQWTAWRSGRKLRSDAGTTALPEPTLHFIAAAKREGLRGNGKAVLHTAVAMNIAHTNGMEVRMSERRINELLRERRLQPRAHTRERAHTPLRSLGPNHLHQIDPSLCLIYYTPRGQAIMRDEEFYKNKPASIDKVRLKVWRYVRYDHASGSIDVRYYEAEGENQRNLYEFLLYTWGAQPGRLSHGVPRMLLWDKGSANTSRAVQNLLDALGVQHSTHAAGHPWAKGGVEQANNLVETHFESRLRIEPVASVEQLNAAAAAWVRDFNANAIAHVDCRIVRTSGQPLVRDALWQRILATPEALVQMPPREVCQWFLSAQEATRVVRDSRISFAHPELARAASYDLSAWAEHLAQGQRVRVVPLLAQGGAVRVEIERLGQEPLLVQAQPERDFDEYGRALSATVVGEGWSRAAATADEHSARTLAATAWGSGVSPDEAQQRRSKNQRPFAHLNDGRGLQAHSHLGRGDLPTRLVPQAQPLSTPAIEHARSQLPTVEVTLTVPEAVRHIQQRLGAAAPADLYQQIKAAHPSGHVSQAWVESWGAQPAAAATGTDDAAPVLRRVK